MKFNLALFSSTDNYWTMNKSSNFTIHTLGLDKIHNAQQTGVKKPG